MKKEPKCDGCNLVFPVGARKGEDYDQIFDTYWHMKPSCIEKVIKNIRAA